MRKFLRISIWFIAIYMVISSLYYANASMMTEMREQTQNFIKVGKENSPDVGGSLDQVFSIGSILTTLGIAVMLGVTAYMGIKYLTSGPEAKGKLKGQLIGVVVSGVVIFGSYYIWKLVIDVFSKFGN